LGGFAIIYTLVLLMNFLFIFTVYSERTGEEPVIWLETILGTVNGLVLLSYIYIFGKFIDLLLKVPEFGYIKCQVNTFFSLMIIMLIIRFSLYVTYTVAYNSQDKNSQWNNTE
jgi:formate hydrogenlyase subunit 3/multisubunit Na+/H+ antiporter MnhD subunit